MEPNFISNFRLVRDIVHHVVACTLFLFGKNIASLVMNLLKSDKWIIPLCPIHVPEDNSREYKLPKEERQELQGFNHEMSKRGYTL